MKVQHYRVAIDGRYVKTKRKFPSLAFKEKEAIALYDRFVEVDFNDTKRDPYEKTSNIAIVHCIEEYASYRMKHIVARKHITIKNKVFTPSQTENFNMYIDYVHPNFK